MKSYVAMSDGTQSLPAGPSDRSGPRTTDGDVFWTPATQVTVKYVLTVNTIQVLNCVISQKIYSDNERFFLISYDI